MRKLICVLLLLAVVAGCCACGRKDGGKYDGMVKLAVEELKRHWTNEIYAPDGNVEKGEGYLQIVNTRVINIKDEPVTGFDTDMFDNVDYIVEFVIFDNYYYSAPFYYSSNSHNDHVAVYKDGSMEVTGDLFNIYRSRYYTSDFSGVIDEVTDLGDKYDEVYILK